MGSGTSVGSGHMCVGLGTYLWVQGTRVVGVRMCGQTHVCSVRARVWAVAGFPTLRLCVLGPAGLYGWKTLRSREKISDSELRQLRAHF